jgi:hypothetical protein
MNKSENNNLTNNGYSTGVLINIVDKVAASPIPEQVKSPFQLMAWYMAYLLPYHGLQAHDNKRNWITFCFICVLLLSMSSCIRASSDNEFSAIVGVEVQHYLKITNLFQSPVKPNTSITLEIANKTPGCVVFPYNYGAKIYIFNNSDWIEIPDNIEYADHADIVLDPRGGLDPGAIVTIRPDYSKLGEFSNRQRMRVFLIGRLCENGLPSKQQTADYIELTVEP